MAERFTPKDARALQNKKAYLRKTVFEGIYRKCKSMMRHYATMGRSMCYYQIPVVEPGAPVYNPVLVRKFLERKLTEEGFTVLPMYLVNRQYSLVLAISWRVPRTTQA